MRPILAAVAIVVSMPLVFVVECVTHTPLILWFTYAAITAGAILIAARTADGTVREGN